MLGDVLCEVFFDDDGDAFLKVCVFSACCVRHVICVQVVFAVGQVNLASLLEQDYVEVFLGTDKCGTLVVEVAIDVQGQDFECL